MAKSSSLVADHPVWSKVWQFCDERLGLAALLELARHKVVPKHSQSFWYCWGGIALLFFGIQFVTGVALLAYYRPGPEAYDSVRRITYDIDFGWLIRSTHSWTANLMIFALFVHMFSVFLMKAYRKPREFGWWSGLVLLGLCMTFGFSGYLLPMDELSFFATKVGLEIPASFPIVGPWMAGLIRGGPTVDADTVQRFFALHVVILPLVTGLVLAFHLYLIQRHGSAVPPSEAAKPEAERRAVPYFPDFLLKETGVWLVALNVLGVMVTLFPWELGPQADPLASAPEGIHPEWYFMSQFQVLKVLGAWFPGAFGEILGLLIFGAIGAVLVLVPLYDRSEDLAKESRTAWWLGIALIAGLIVMTLWGYLAL